MALAKERPLFDPPVDYEDDTYQWAFQQAELLRQRRFVEADIPNIIEELESMGRSERFKLEASYRLIISHLLKWEYQPSKRSRSWRTTITRERNDLRKREAQSPALATAAASLVAEAYPDAVDEAVSDTDLPYKSFPPVCPWSLAQLRDKTFFPGPDSPLSDHD